MKIRLWKSSLISTKEFLTMEPGQVIPGTDILFISIFINRLSACYTEFTSMPTFHIGPSVSEELPCKAKGFTSLVMEIRWFFSDRYKCELKWIQRISRTRKVLAKCHSCDYSLSLSKPKQWATSALVEGGGGGQGCGFLRQHPLLEWLGWLNEESRRLRRSVRFVIVVDEIKVDSSGHDDVLPLLQTPPPLSTLTLAL